MSIDVNQTKNLSARKLKQGPSRPQGIGTTQGIQWPSALGRIHVRFSVLGLEPHLGLSLSFRSPWKASGQ
jgi:hypothetical protein